MSRGVIHFGDNSKPACRPNEPFAYTAWSTYDRNRVTCKRCLAWIEKTRAVGKRLKGRS